MMIHTLPHDLSNLDAGTRDRAVEELDRRVTALLRRWPHALSPTEAREAVRLWNERMRLARDARRRRSRERASLQN